MYLRKRILIILDYPIFTIDKIYIFFSGQIYQNVNKGKAVKKYTKTTFNIHF